MGLSLIMGLVAIGGSLIPLMMQHPEQLARPADRSLFIPRADFSECSPGFGRQQDQTRGFSPDEG